MADPSTEGELGGADLATHHQHHQVEVTPVHEQTAETQSIAATPGGADTYQITEYHDDTSSTALPTVPAVPPPTAPSPPPPAPQAGVKRSAEEANGSTAASDAAAVALAKKKRLCRYPGCTKVIKSQGHCQRHGARAKRCKVEGCDKQAQGTHDGMCKRHWKAANFPEEASKKGSTPPEPEGESVYDSILPLSIAYRPVQQKPLSEEATDPQSPSKNETVDPPAAPDGFHVMPLVQHLKDGSLAGKPPGWHRNEERRARGMFPVKGLSVQLEPWERQLALMEILLLSGGTPYANFKELAYAWGREKGFHHVLATSVCERRGEVERKKRSDAGKSMTDEEKLAFRSKLQKSRDKNGTSKKAKRGEEEEVLDEDDEADSMQQQQALDHQHQTMAVEEEHDMKTSLVAVDGGSMVEETVTGQQNPIEGVAAGMSQIVHAGDIPI